MSEMVALIYGRQNTGKSAYYESLLEHYDNILYFATLQNKEQHFERIKRHKKRRSSKWIVCESTGDTLKDAAAISAAIQNANKPVYIMIDCITNWCLYCASNSREFINEANKVADLIIHMSASYSSVDWYLLENIRDDYLGNPAREQIWDVINERLLHGIADINLINWRSDL